MVQDLDSAPLCGDIDNMLGVRTSGNIVDVILVADGTTDPDDGGLSLSINPRKLVKWLRPVWLGGKAQGLVLYEAIRDQINSANLRIRKDKGNHATVIPNAAMKIDDFQSELCSTRTTAWKEVREGDL